jgi:chromosome segregation ATPase
LLICSRDHEDHLENALAEMKQQMDDLKSDLATERNRLQHDNRRLQDLVSEINLKRTAEVDSFKSELARLEVETEEEIQAAKDEVVSMKQELTLLMQVSRPPCVFAIGPNLQDKRTSSDRIQKLEQELAEQMDAYDDLSAQVARQDRNNDQQEELDAQKSLIDKLESRLRDTNMSTDRIRLSLKEKTDALRHAETTVASLQRERASITKELLEFEADLQHQRAESETFGRELRSLKMEQSGSARLKEDMAVLQRNYRFAKDALQQAKDQLATAVRRAAELEKWQSTHLRDRYVLTPSYDHH